MICFIDWVYPQDEAEDEYLAVGTNLFEMRPVASCQRYLLLPSSQGFQVVLDLSLAQDPWVLFQVWHLEVKGRPRFQSLFVPRISNCLMLAALDTNEFIGGL